MFDDFRGFVMGVALTATVGGVVALVYSFFQVL